MIMDKMLIDKVEIMIFAIMLIIVFYSSYKHDGNLKQTILYTLWTFIIFWANAPILLVGAEGLEIKQTIFKIPFELYKLLDIVYVIFGNILLAMAGNWIAKSREKVNCVNEKTIKKKFDDFSKDASELKIVGRDLDFLAHEDYRDQAEHIKKLKNKAQLLCEQTDERELIELYHNLIKNGNLLRYYTEREGIVNLKAQIKVDMHRKEFGLFATKIDYSSKNELLGHHNNFEINFLESGFLLQAVSREFDRIFRNSLNPVIKCIALDLGGVYFDGDLDVFYSFLLDKYEIKMSKNKFDKLNINDKLMLGEINIREFIKNKTTTKYKCNQLKGEEWEDIIYHWNENWKANKDMKKLLEFISSEGIFVVPFSNLDRDNGNKYLREQYLPACCTEHFFSYEQGCSKPMSEAFDNFFWFVHNKFEIQYPFQILLIDDQDENISMAREKEWYSIKYINGKDDLKYLLSELKTIGIIPDDFTLR